MVNFSSLAVVNTALFSSALATPMVAVNGHSSEVTVQGGSPIKGKYLIALKPGLRARDLDTHIGWVDGVHRRGLSAQQFRGIERTYSGKYNFHGYAGHFDEATIATIRKNPQVAVVEQDREWELAFIHEDHVEPRDDATRWRHLSTQRNSTWSLAAISHRYRGSLDYVYNSRAGQGTFAYVVDSGVFISHKEFEGRAQFAFTAFENETTDTFGHGTHVAGTIGGKTYGVAKKAKILSVKVFKCRRSATSIILQGFDWAANNIIDKGRNKKAAINLSLGGSFSRIFNLVIETASEAGVLCVVAAGNEARDASDMSPASAPSAITVGALAPNWTMASYSNFGPVVDIFGPGSNITSAWIRNDTDSRSISGTSMATPHLVGLALTAMSVDHVWGVAEVTENLKETATKGCIEGDIKDSPNLIGNNNVHPSHE